MQIKKVSQKLLKEAVMTLPWKISNGSIVLIAEGVMKESFSRYNKKKERKYLSQCRKKGIIPDSNIILKYISGSFVLDIDHQVVNPYDFGSTIIEIRKPTKMIEIYEPGYKQVIDGVTSSKRFYAIELRLEENARRTKEFIPPIFGDLLNKTLKNGYQICTIDMRLDDIPASGNSGMKSGLQYGTPQVDGIDKRKQCLELKLTDPPKGSRTKLINWFNELARKYDWR